MFLYGFCSWTLWEMFHYLYLRQSATPFLQAFSDCRRTCWCGEVDTGHFSPLETGDRAGKQGLLDKRITPMRNSSLQCWIPESDFPLFPLYTDAAMLVSLVGILAFWPDAIKDCLIIKDVQTLIESSDFFLWYLEIVVTPKVSEALLRTVFIKLVLSAEFHEGTESGNSGCRHGFCQRNPWLSYTTYVI